MWRWSYFVVQSGCPSAPTSEYTLFTDIDSLPNLHSNSDANMDTWPRATVHQYGPDARRAIIQALNNYWDELFLVANDAGVHYDGLVEADLLLPNFYDV